MAHHVLFGQLDHGDAVDRPQAVRNVGQAGDRRQQVALLRVAGHNHGRVPAEPGQQHLDLAVGAVLRLVDDDKGVVEGAPAHIGDRGDLDRAVADQLLQPLAAQAVGQGVVERPEIGRQLLLHRPGQVAQGLAGLDRRPGQEDAADAPILEGPDRSGDRQIGLAGAGGADGDGQVVRLDRFHELALAVAIRLDPADEALVAVLVQRVPCLHRPGERGDAVVVFTTCGSGAGGSFGHGNLVVEP